MEDEILEYVGSICSENLDYYDCRWHLKYGDESMNSAEIVDEVSDTFKIPPEESRDKTTNKIMKTLTNRYPNMPDACKTQAHQLSGCLSELDRYMESEVKVHFDDADMKLIFSMSLQRNVDVDFTHFIDEQDSKYVVYSIFQNGDLVVLQEGNLDDVVSLLIQALS